MNDLNILGDLESNKIGSDVYVFDRISFVSLYVQLRHDFNLIPSVELKLLDHAHRNSN